MDPQGPMNPTGEPSIELDAGDGRGFQSIDQVTAQIEGTSIDAQNETENFPPNVKLRIDALKELQQEQAQLEDQFEKERRILELKYEKLYTPLYEKRAGIVSGRTKMDAEQSVDDNVVGIPGFWLRAFMNHSAIAEIIEDHDVPVFAYLMDVRSISHEEDNGFRLEFEFSSNPYFGNNVLTKEYDVADATDSGDAVLKNVKGCTIDWKEGKDLTKRVKKVKQRAKGGKSTRVISRTEGQESFFDFFQNVSMPSEDEDDQESAALMDQLTTDFQIGFTIHETIIPQAVLWFTGEIEEEQESEYEDDNDDDSDSEEAESDDEDSTAQKEKHPVLENKTNATEKPPECKNQ